jgi:hypothetical protein
MLAIAIFFAVIAFALLVGIGAFWLVRRYSLWITIPATFFLTLFTVLFAAVTFLVAYNEFPATDRRNWSQLDRIEVLMDTSAKKTGIDQRARSAPSVYTGRQLQIYAGDRSKVDLSGVNSDLKISIGYPAETISGNDITVVLTITASGAQLPPGELSAVLRSQSLKAWTTQSCKSTPRSSGTEPACVNLKIPKDSIEFIWTASPTGQGVRQIAIEFPPVWRGDEWTAILAKNSELILDECQRGHERPCSWNPRLLSASSSSYGAPRGDFSVDISRGDVRLPIKVLTTLGLSSFTYGLLAILGMVLSGALGSGWLFKLVETLKPPSATPKHQPIRRPKD